MNLPVRMSPVNKFRCGVTFALLGVSIFVFIVFARSGYKSGNHENVISSKSRQIDRKGMVGGFKINFQEKIVHLDLKGMAPKVEYLKYLFSLFQKLGATGVLMEYEDMLPLFDELSSVNNDYAYTNSQLNLILAAAKQNNLKIIPLVQTFGHLEWLLKSSKYAYLREVPKYSQVLCPSTKEGQKLVHTLIDQVVKLHPEITMLHIGSDEAYFIGDGNCERCNKAAKGYIDKLAHNNRNQGMQSSEDFKQRLLLKQISDTAKYVNETHGLRVLAWYDMFESVEFDVLQKYELGSLLEPVFWNYWPNLDDSAFPHGTFPKFSSAFPKMWIASAFKGANGADQTFIDVDHYLSNNVAWLKILRNNWQSFNRGKQLGGVILTGWQRFDHFGALCEILPNSIPSLALNLLTMSKGVFLTGTIDLVREILNCTEKGKETKSLLGFWEDVKSEYRSNIAIPLNSIDCEFVGSNVYKLTEHLKLAHAKMNAFYGQSKMKWMNKYNLKSQYGNVFFAEEMHSEAEELISQLNNIGRGLELNLTPLIYEDQINEFLYSNVGIYVEKLMEDSRDLLMISKTISFRNRPLQPMHLEF